ncbi:MAG TPA: four helix bundle protein [Candidatus Cloacimonadota bacterium]|nr:four helix bundle protein [Candidatus Cloacimonadota bacterium]
MHKDLDIWKLGIELVEKIYKVTRKFPESERFGLISQLQRAAISYPSNIAEGAARNSVKEYIQFLYISLGSLSEIETQLIIAARLTFMNEDELTEEIEILRRKHLNFIKYLKNKNT